MRGRGGGRGGGRGRAKGGSINNLDASLSEGDLGNDGGGGGPHIRDVGHVTEEPHEESQVIFFLSHVIFLSQVILILWAVSVKSHVKSHRKRILQVLCWKRMCSLWNVFSHMKSHRKRILEVPCWILKSIDCYIFTPYKHHINTI